MPEYYLEKLNFYFNQAKDCIKSEVLVPDILYYEGCLKIKNDLSTYSIAKAKEYIKNESEVNWLNALTDDNSILFNLIYLFFRDNLLDSIPLDLQSAYAKWLKSLVETAKIPSNEDERWNIIFTKLNNHEITTPVKDIRDLFINEKTISPELFLFFSPLFELYGELKENPKGFVRKILTPLFTNTSCSQYFLNKYKFYNPLIKDAKDDSSSLKTSLLIEYRDNPERENLKTCIEDLGLEIPKHEQDNENIQ